ncbi:MAG: prenyltransferase [Candidatus Bathyarchaeia archaeon]
MGLRVWFREAVEPSLLMSFLLVSLGTAVAARDSSFNSTYYVLAIVGVTLAQNSVNVLNDYYDYKAGVDAATLKTPFSGGSKFLVSGLIKPKSALSFGLASLLLAIPIGAYFVLTRGLALLGLLAVAAISVYFYSTTFARIYLGEFLAGLNLGPLAIIGAYFVQTATISVGAVAVGLAPGIMIANVLYLNEMPDLEADAAAGRRNLPILLGRKRGAKLYALLESIAVAWIPTAVILGLTPPSTLIALAASPFVIKAIRIALREYSNTSELVPALTANVAAAYITIALLAVGYVISAAMRL